MNQLVRDGSTTVAGNQRVKINTANDSTSSVVVFSSPTDVFSRPRFAPSEAMKNAVYSHIQAVRALGRTEITASEIANALSVPVLDVIDALKALRDKGVRIAG
jgi:hypothetical protein